ncbi:lysoplasmalogenase family protein [Aeromicrobium sp. CF4.19]|uniref:lysoplasmalogenase family protein n=1 Tax=Aeromicrobium sp. CF4.19 TaxID=3373082 RepID=UPI003EE4B971
MTTTLRGPWVAAFGAAVALHLVLLGADLSPWDSITKCLLAPLLVCWVLAVRGPHLLVAALVFCFLGDLFLELDGLFIVGMAAFALGHVCLVVLLVRRGALEALRARPWIVAVYVVAAIVLVAWAWGGLPDELKAPVPVYAVLLLATAATSAGVDRVAGAGGLLFLVSDGIIALGEAGRIDSGATLTGLAVMTLYSAAILLLTAGILRHDATPAA